MRACLAATIFVRDQGTEVSAGKRSLSVAESVTESWI